MKKILAIFILLFFMAPAAHALELDSDGRTSSGWLAREGYVMSRGLVNILTFPLEFIRTPKIEKQFHPKAWPLTFFPRSFMNAVTRLTSGAHDLVLFPFYVSFTNDLTPWTEGFDLPVYVWQKE